jgi:hypothetical protein
MSLIKDIRFTRTTDEVTEELNYSFPVYLLENKN